MHRTYPYTFWMVRYNLLRPPGTVSYTHLNWLMGETLRLLKEKNMDPEDIRFAPGNLAKLIGLVDAKAINSSVAKEVFEVIIDSL